MSNSALRPNPTRRVTLLINGQILTSWTKVKIVRGLHEICGSFELEYVDAGRDAETLHYEVNLADFAPLEAGAAVQLQLDGEPILVGWLDKVRLKQTATRLEASASGRDICGDLVDCAAFPNGPAEFANITLTQLATKVCAPFKIGVQSQTNVGAPFIKLSTSPHEKAMPTIEKAARQRGVLIVSDGVANLLLTTAGSTTAPGNLTVGRNVAAVEFEDDHTKRFSDVYVKGQTARACGNHAGVAVAMSPATAPGVAPPPATTTQAESAGIVMTGHAQDTLITRWRPDVRMVRTQSGSSTVQEQAEWHVRVDRGMSQHIKYEVLDWRAGAARALWRPNQMTTVYDPFDEIDGQKLIELVEFTYAEKEGARTSLHLVDKAAYERIDEPARSQKRHSLKGGR